MRSRFRTRLTQTLASVFIRYPVSSLFRVHFDYFYRYHNQQANEFISEEFSLDPEEFSYKKTEGVNVSERVTTRQMSKSILKKEFEHFLRILHKSGFVYASCGNHFEHEGIPKVSQSRQYELSFFFGGNKTPFLSIEKFGDGWYGLDYPDLEKFEAFEGYLRDLAQS